MTRGLVFGLPALLLGSMAVAQEPAIRWETNLAKTMAAAKETQELVFVFVTTEW